MSVIPGPVSYTEGDALRDSIGALLECLSEIENRAGSTWVGSTAPGVRKYRLEMRRTIEKAIDLLRAIHPLAPYVGGKRAEDLKDACDAATKLAGEFRDEPDETTLRSMVSSVIDAVRNSFDLVMLGSSVNAAHEHAVQTTSEAKAAVEARLGDFSTTMETLATTLRQEISGANATIREQADRLGEEVSARGKDVVARTRKAVAGVLLNDAQEQFANAQRWFNWQVAIWATLSGATATAFLWTTSTFISTQNLPAHWTWQLAFYAGMRLVLLGGIAGIGSFCLRMLKSQIMLAQLNAHRTRVARSMPGLLEVAPEANALPYCNRSFNPSSV